MARVLVGLPALKGDPKKYSSRYDMVELRPVDTSLPRVQTLRAWRRAVPPSFVFSVILPRVVGSLEKGPELDAALDEALKVATAVEARCIVLRTSSAVRPTATSRARLQELFDRIPREGVIRCWEAAGIWEAEDVVATARSLRVVPVLDASRDELPAGPVAYTRLSALGRAAGPSTAAIDKLADRLRGRREAFIVVEGAGALRVKVDLLAALGRGKQPLGALIVRPSLHNLIAEDEEQ